MITFFERLDNYFKFKGLNDNKVTLETGISNGLIGKARKRGSLSQENISKLLYTYQDLNANWLLTGKGSMLKEEENIEEIEKPPTDQSELLELYRFKVKTLEEELEKIKKELAAEKHYHRLSIEGKEKLKKQKKEE